MTRKNLAALAVACGLALAACGGDQSSDDTSVSIPDDTTTTVAPDDTVDADNVLLAVALLEIGDVDAALAGGFVNPDEVDAAAQSVGDGTLDGWVEMADGR
jgi:ABC-type glycerol-3-phosphate transport system substrate-binding protein